MFRTVPPSITRGFSLYTQRWRMSYWFADSLRAGSGWNPDPARKLSAKLYDIYHCCVYSEKLLMMDRGTVRNMQSFNPKINFEKLVHFVIRKSICNHKNHLLFCDAPATFLDLYWDLKHILQNGCALFCSIAFNPSHTVMAYEPPAVNLDVLCINRC